MLEEYEINCSTIAIIPVSENISRVMEDDNVYMVNKSTNKIIDDSCKYFGSSYLGRFEGSKKLLGSKIYKAPIIVEESQEIIYFPTGSSRDFNCTWISLAKIKKYEKRDYKTIIMFKNEKDLELEISYESLSNQVLRASRLESILRSRKNTQKSY